MDSNQASADLSIREGPSQQSNGELVEEPVETSPKASYDLPLDTMQELVDGNDHFSPEVNFSPGRSYGRGPLSPSDHLNFDRYQEPVISPSADNYPYNYRGNGGPFSDMGIRRGRPLDREREFDGFGYQETDYRDTLSKSDRLYGSGFGANSSRWDGYRDRYGNTHVDPISPRYLDVPRWGDLEEERYASPSLGERNAFYGRGIQQEVVETSPSSYTQGMHYRPHRRGSFAHSIYPAVYPPLQEGYDDYYHDMDGYADRSYAPLGFSDVERRPFSNPSSPTPITHPFVFSDNENYFSSRSYSTRGGYARGMLSATTSGGLRSGLTHNNSSTMNSMNSYNNNNENNNNNGENKMGKVKNMEKKDMKKKDVDDDSMNNMNNMNNSMATSGIGALGQSGFRSVSHFSPPVLPPTSPTSPTSPYSYSYTNYSRSSLSSSMSIPMGANVGVGRMSSSTASAGIPSLSSVTPISTGRIGNSGNSVNSVNRMYGDREEEGEEEEEFLDQERGGRGHRSSITSPLPPPLPIPTSMSAPIPTSPSSLSSSVPSSSLSTAMTMTNNGRMEMNGMQINSSSSYRSSSPSTGSSSLPANNPPSSSTTSLPPPPPPSSSSSLSSSVPRSQNLLSSENMNEMGTPGASASASASSPVGESTNTNGGAKEDEDYQINARAIMQNQEERTVVLIRNIPNRYKLEDLSRVIEEYVDEEFQILRLPIDVYTKRNLGYAFVTFSDSHEVLKLFYGMNGKRWPNSNSQKTFFMCYAKKQNYGMFDSPTDPSTPMF